MPIRAPRLPTQVPWLNTERPLLPEELLGRIVVLDFWTYCCINCLHTLPVLARLERLFADQPVAFIGVHSPKFFNERDEGMVREAVRRFGVTHPVVIDADHRTWEAYAIRAWPTLVVIDPFGYVLGQFSGEPDAEALEGLLTRLLSDYRARGVELATTPLPIRPEPAIGGALAYPGKLVARGARLWIADTGHHQVVELELQPAGPAREIRRFGSGAPGFANGVDAAFQHPRGLALDESSQALWVADTGNHAIRRIDLDEGSVTTVAGTGEKGGFPVAVLQPRRTALRSPWDVCWDRSRGLLYVAMAGSHQLFALDPTKDTLRVLAGTGHEARLDGALDACAFAQPSGLALLGDRLYVADSEISAVREVDLALGQVRTVAGGDLFEFGDDDGRGDTVRFQHPMGIAAGDGRLFLADSFNHKVKELEPDSGRAVTRYGNGDPLLLGLLPTGGVAFPAVWRADATAPLFFEPEGLWVDEGRLFVADTNNHRVLEIGLGDGQAHVVAGD